MLAQWPQRWQRPQKKLRTMIKNIFLITGCVVFASCSKKMQPTHTVETVEKEVITFVPKDTTIYLPGDSVTIYEMVPCPDAEWQSAAKSETGKTTVTAKISKGTISIDCKTDSLLQRIAWLEKQSAKVVTITETVHAKPKRFIPKWVWWLLVLNVIYVGWKFRNPIASLIKKVTG